MPLVAEQRGETALAIPPVKTPPVKTPLVKTKKAGISVRTVLAEDLPAFTENWRKLAESATVANPFYEPFMLLPAVAHLGTPSKNLRFLLVFGPGDEGNQPLWGFFPLEVQNRCFHLPIKTLALWKYRYCYLTAPLIQAGHEWEVLDAFWRWFEANPLGCHLLDTNYLPFDPSFHNVWSDFAIGRLNFVINEHVRAQLVSEGNAEDYLGKIISTKHAHEHKRLMRRLQDYGEVRYERLDNLSKLDDWIESFLRLEASGWKGTDAGNAIAKEKEDAAFFREMTREGFRNGNIMMLALTINGTPVAMKHNILGHHTAFANKIAFDETYSKCSPGLLLELQNIRELFADSRIADMDSCAIPRHPMADRIFTQRRLIRRTLFSRGSRLGDLLVSALPLMRWLRTTIRPSAVLPYLQISTKQHPAIRS